MSDISGSSPAGTPERAPASPRTSPATNPATHRPASRPEGGASPRAADLRVEAVTIRYGRRTAIDDVSFHLGVGVTGLLGPNGAGKSTLLRTVASAQRPDSGTVHLAGIELNSPEQLRAARRRLGYLPQAPGFYPGYRVSAFAHHVAVLKEIGGRDARAEEVRRVLAAVDLSDRAEQKIKALSGGMRQRLALACALLGDPQVLILDEPTVGLDPEQRLRFREVIARLGRERVVLLSTHQSDDVASLCSRVLVLHQGRVLLDGDVKSLASVAAGRVWGSAEPATPTVATPTARPTAGPTARPTARPTGEFTAGPSAGPSAGQVLATWATGDGTFRTIGHPPHGADLLPPTLDEGYLVLMNTASTASPAGTAGVPAERPGGSSSTWGQR